MSVTDTTNVICDMAGVLPFKGNAVGTVYTRCVFEHLTNPGLFLNEVSRILKPGGRLLLITDNAAYWRYHVSMRFGRYSIGMPHAAHVTAYNTSDRHFGLYLVGHLRQHADRAGLLVRDLKLVDFEERGSAHLLDRILRRVPHLSAFSYPRIYLFATKPSGRESMTDCMEMRPCFLKSRPQPPVVATGRGGQAASV